jgi:hypothetical protein
VEETGYVVPVFRLAHEVHTSPDAVSSARYIFHPINMFQLELLAFDMCKDGFDRELALVTVEIYQVFLRLGEMHGEEYLVADCLKVGVEFGVGGRME